MLHRTEGIVLRTIPFGEADLIVTFLTSDQGIVKAFAKSPRKIKSRFGSSLEPLTWSRISYWGKEDAALPRLTQADILHPFHSIRDRLHCFVKVSEIVELTLNFVPERDSSGKVYTLLTETLRAVEENCDMGLLVMTYKLKLLEIVGYLPRLNGCGRCGRCGRQGEAFHLSHGTVLCERGSKGHEASFYLSPGVVRLYTGLLCWSVPKIGRIKPPEALLGELSKVIDEHIRYIIEKNLRTKAFRIS